MFKCSGCGACCCHVDRAVKLTQHDERFIFPYKWDESGRCEMLDDNNKCKVYEERPLLCNVDEIMKLINVDKDSFYEQNRQACNNLMDADGIDESFRL